MALVPLKEPQFLVRQDLEKATDSEWMQAYIKGSFANMNIHETFSTLVDCGSLLQIAQTAAGDQPCSVSVLHTLSEFHTTVSESTVVSAAFVETSMAALRSHKAAIEVFEGARDAEDIEDGLEELRSCAEMASNMAKKADQVVVKVDNLVQLAEKSLLQAKKDSVDNVELCKKIEAKMNELEALKVGRQKTLDILQEDLQNAIEKEEKVAREAAQARDRQFGLELAGTILGSVGGMVSSMMPLTSPAAIVGTVIGKGVGKGVGGESGQSAAGSGQGAKIPEPASGAVDPAKAQDAARRGEGELASLNTSLKNAQSAVDKDTPDGQKRIEDLKQQVGEKERQVQALKGAFKELAVMAEKRAVTLEEKEAEAGKMRHELAKQKREQAGELEKNISEMASMKTDKTQVEQTVLTLSSCVQTLGLVKNTFVNTKLFWEMVASKCKTLEAMKGDYDRKGKRMIKDWGRDDVDKTKSNLMECVQISAQCWAGIGRVSLDANIAIHGAKAKVDSVMSKLPTGDATDKEIKKLTTELQPRLLAIKSDAT